MRTARTVVIKVGGSLLKVPGFFVRLGGYLAKSEGEKQVLVVGGGGAADFVRVLDATHAIGEERSHALALRALDLTAHVVAALVEGVSVVERPGQLDEIWRAGGVPALAPRWFLENVDRRSADPLSESWSVTTDSIAARVAHHIRADELRLLKSTGLVGRTSRVGAAEAEVVDPAFPTASAGCPRVVVVNFREDPPTVEEMDAS